jgi:PAS fold
MRLVIDSLPGVVFYVDRAASQWFQRPPSDFEGREIAEVMGRSAFEQVREYAELALSGEDVVFECHPDRERDVHVNYLRQKRNGRYASDPVRSRGLAADLPDWKSTSGASTVASSVRAKTFLRIGSVPRRHLPRTDRCPKGLP